MYRIVYEKEAGKFLRKIPAKFLPKIKTKIEAIARNPFSSHANLSPIKGAVNICRLRIGNLRIVYELDLKNKLIIVWKIGFRSSVYRQ